MRVAIVGAGFIGAGWSVVFARAGHEVRIYDRDPQIAAQAAALNTRLRSEASDSAAWGSVEIVNKLPDAVLDADWVQESAPERAALKAEIFGQVDALALQPSSFLAEVEGRHRCLVAHPFNPPYLLPLVELAPSAWTAPEIVEAAHEIMRGLGQHPVIVKKETSGFLANRLQAAVIAEAISLVGRGVADPQDIDTCMRSGLGLRWAFLGPFETMDLNAPGGFADYVARFGASYQDLTRDLHVGEPWSDAAVGQIEAALRAKSPLTALSARAAWRDAMVAKLRCLVGADDTPAAGRTAQEARA